MTSWASHFLKQCAKFCTVILRIPRKESEKTTEGGKSCLTRLGGNMLDPRDAAFLARLSGRVAAVEFAVGAIRSIPDKVTRRVIEQELEDVLRDAGPGDFGLL